MGEFRKNNASIKKFNLYSMYQDQKEAQVLRFGLKIGRVQWWRCLGQVATDWRPKNHARVSFEDKIAAEGQTCNHSNPKSQQHSRRKAEEESKQGNIIDQKRNITESRILQATDNKYFLDTQKPRKFIRNHVVQNNVLQNKERIKKMTVTFLFHSLLVNRNTRDGSS